MCVDCDCYRLIKNVYLVAQTLKFISNLCSLQIHIKGYNKNYSKNRCEMIMVTLELDYKCMLLNANHGML